MSLTSEAETSCTPTPYYPMSLYTLRVITTMLMILLHSLINTLRLRPLFLPQFFVAGYFTQGRGLAPRPLGSPRLVLNPGATRDALALGRGRSPQEVLAGASSLASAASKDCEDALCSGAHPPRALHRPPCHTPTEVGVSTGT